MLEQLLNQLKQSGTYHVPALARQFGVSEALVEQMLAELARLGYLRPLETCHSKACSGCPQSSACSPGTTHRLWVVDHH